MPISSWLIPPPPSTRPASDASGAVFTIEYDSTLAGDTNTLVTVPAGSVFDVHNLAARTLAYPSRGRQRLRTRSGFGRDTRNVITGPVETSGNGDSS